MTYFPIPGEGAWVLLREFCQTKWGREHYVHRQGAGYTFTEDNYIHGIHIAFLWFWEFAKQNLIPASWGQMYL